MSEVDVKGENNPGSALGLTFKLKNLNYPLVSAQVASNKLCDLVQLMQSIDLLIEWEKHKS